MPHIDLQNVSYSYPNGYEALVNISLGIQKGECIAVIGQNGAGKTTVVKLMNGLLRPCKGDVLVDGLNTKTLTTAQLSKKVSYVFQNPDDQIFHNSVAKEIAFGPKNLKLSEKQVKQAVAEAVEMTQIEEFMDENPYDLPLSVRKFVTIASVLAMNSDVIILDEPTAGQDLLGINRLSQLIDRLRKKGKTIIAITHDMEFVADHFKRVVVMAHKNIIDDDDMSSVFWKDGLLKESGLKQPHISRLSDMLNYDGQITTIKDFITYFNKNSIAPR